MSSCVWTLYFTSGLSAGAPTVLLPQVRRDWTHAPVDDHLASWLYSTSNFSAIPWIFFLPKLSQTIGRKIPYLACCVAMTTVFILLYFSSMPYHILIALAIHGLVNASSVTMLFHVIPEYTNHNYRNMYLNIQSTSFYWGMWASNAIGTFFPWKYITVLGFICTVYTFTVSFYPESPRWLASRGKFTECEAAHRWLHGSNYETEKELRDLLKSQEGYRRDDQRMTISGLLKTMTCKQFYKPLLLVMLVGAQYNLSGKFVCSIYAIDALKRITKSEEAAYTGMLMLDGVTVFGMYVGCFLSKILKLRPLFFSLSFLSICIMFTFSLYLYLANLGIIRQNNVVTLGFLLLYSLAISSGPIIICLSIYSVLISMRYQAISYVMTAFVFLVLCTGMLKFSPIFFMQFGIHGSFLFYGTASGIATIILFIYLPETKNKTLVEIEECFKDSRLSEVGTMAKLVKNNILNDV